uniref:Uncharacterized LOC100178581 n=1 Tax=Ciona intestinalis TaxID=7719 RepID=F7ARU9_CIOIN|nr:uncharacterized protein LOC100178581 [Ciona intestinalis]|eukprot:XP_002132132.1 uncharacterized protein LOC100178581 [Ciona intestinalis]
MNVRWISLACLVLVFAAYQIEAQQITCAPNNGGCSHTCLFRGTGNRTCGCPCGFALDSSLTNCVPSNPCNVDLYILIDVSMNTDPIACILNTAFTNWLTWRNNVVGVLNSFVADDAGSTYHVGVQTFSSGFPTTINLYNDTNLQPAITTLSTTATPTCTALGEFISQITFAVESFPSLTNFQYRGPGVRRDPMTTSRIAMVLNAGPGGTNLAAINARLPTIMSQMDDILVVTSKIIADNTQSALNEDISRLAACGSTAAACGDVFYFDSPNSDGLAVSGANLKSKMNTSACLARRGGATPVVTTNCGQTFTATIPKCLLNGLTLSDLSLSDPLCTITGVESGSNYIVSIPFIGCGITTSAFVDSSGNPKTNFTQIIQTRNISANQILPSFSTKVQCHYAAYVEPPVVVALNKSFNGTAASGSTFQLETLAFKDSSYTTRYMSTDCIPVDTSVYLRASAALSSVLTLKVWSMHATPSANENDAQSYPMITAGCAVDSSVVILPSASNEVKIKYNMFEFSSTATASNANKLPVYLHLSFNLCVVNDTSAACTQTCTQQPGRRKRSLADVKVSRVKTLGPFKVGSNKQGPLNENFSPTHVLIRRGQINHGYLNNVTLLMMAIFAVFVIEVIRVRRSKLQKVKETKIALTEEVVLQPNEEKVDLSKE